MRWWPVTLHCFCVADLLPAHLKLDGLLHDAPECITGDMPKPVKTDEMEAFEERLLVNVYKSFELRMPSPAQRVIIKQADKRVLRGEVYTVGTQALQGVYGRYPRAERLVVRYLAEFPPLECISPDGRAPIEFMRRFRMYKDLR